MNIQRHVRQYLCNPIHVVHIKQGYDLLNMLLISTSIVDNKGSFLFTHQPPLLNFVIRGAVYYKKA